MGSTNYSTHGSEDMCACKVEPLNKGHLGTQAAVPYSEVVPYWEVRDKTVILCTFTASMMYKTHYGVVVERGRSGLRVPKYNKEIVTWSTGGTDES